MECLGPSVPYSTLHDRVKKLGLTQTKLSLKGRSLPFLILALIEDNQSLKSWLENRSMPFIEYFDVPLQGKSIGNFVLEKCLTKMIRTNGQARSSFALPINYRCRVVDNQQIDC